MSRGKSIRECEHCGKQFLGGNKRKYCKGCEKEIWYTCPDCGKPKRYKYSTWCYPCSLEHRDTSKNSESFKKAVEAARSPEACRARSKALMGHVVTAETRAKIGQANLASGHLQEAGRKGGLAGKGKKHNISPEWRQHLREQWTGPENPVWKDGSTILPYGEGWTEELREMVRERDNRVCQICNRPENTNGKRLDVHHIDGSKSNHDPDNLVSLCHYCHQKVTVGSIEYREKERTENDTICGT